MKIVKVGTYSFTLLITDFKKGDFQFDCMFILIICDVFSTVSFVNVVNFVLILVSY